MGNNPHLILYVLYLYIQSCSDKLYIIVKVKAGTCIPKKFLDFSLGE